MQIKKIHPCTGHRAAIYALAEGSGDRFFLSAGGDGWIVEWNLDAPETGRLIARTESKIFSLCSLSEQDILVAGNMDGGLHWIRPNEGGKSKDILHHKKGVFDLLPLGDHLYSAGGDGVLTRWSIAEARALESIQLSGESMRCMALHPERREIAIGASDGHIYVVNADTMVINYTIHSAHDNSVFCLAWTPDGKRLLSGGRDAWLRVWNEQGKPDLNGPKEAAHMFTINHLAFSPDGSLFATASRDKTIKIWDTYSLKLLKVLDTIRHGGHINSVNRLLWLPEMLVSASDDQRAIIWEVEP